MRINAASRDRKLDGRIEKLAQKAGIAAGSVRSALFTAEELNSQLADILVEEAPRPSRRYDKMTTQTDRISDQLDKLHALTLDVIELFEQIQYSAMPPI